jgi:hypothetical protein
MEGAQYKTSPIDADTDGDGLLDGTEDANQDGDWEHTLGFTKWRDTAETNPVDADTDNDQMPDGWECYFDLNPLKVIDRIADPDNDGLLNYQEYVIGTDPNGPGSEDTDGDGLLDGLNFDIYPTNTFDIFIDPIFPDADIIFGGSWDDPSDDPDEEAVSWGDPTTNGLGDGEILGIYFRTNVFRGAKYIDYYGKSSSQYILLKNDGHWWKYFYDNAGPHVDVDMTVNSEAYSRWDTNNLIAILYDLTRIYHNTTTNKLYIWAPQSDHSDDDENEILEGYYFVFGSVVMDPTIPGLILPSTLKLLIPEVEYKDQELYDGGNPLHNDTDDDRVLDSDEYRWDSDDDGVDEYYWDVDSDWDGLVNIRDTDSDNDGIYDGDERRGLAPYIYNDKYESEIVVASYNADVDDDNLPNMVDEDSDNDMLPDGLEHQWYTDTDKDGYDNMIDRDSDSDGLLDGFEDVNGNLVWDPDEKGEDIDINGKVDPTETDPRKKDTDADGLNDTEEIINTQLLYEAESPDVCIIPSQQVVSDSIASSNEAIVNVPGKSDVGNLQLTLIPGEYRFYVRARLAEDATEGIMRLQVANTDIPYSEYEDFKQSYKWYSTDLFFLGVDTDVTLKIFDKSGTTPGIFVDKIVLAKFAWHPDVTNFIDDSGSSDTKTLIFSSGPDEQTVYVDIPYPGYYAVTAALDMVGDDEPDGSANFPTNPYLDVGDTNDKQWFHPNRFDDSCPTETTPDFAHEINRYIYTNKDSLDITANTIRIPLTFHSDSVGKLEISNLRIVLKSFISDPSDPDTDGDGLYDGDEVQAVDIDGILNFYPTKPDLADTDNDLLTDKEEVVGWDIYIEDMEEPDIIHVVSNPLLVDTDGDGILDFEEIANSAYYIREAELIPHLSFGPRNEQTLNVGSGPFSNPNYIGAGFSDSVNPETMEENPEYCEVAVGDVDGDGDNDIAILTGKRDMHIQMPPNQQDVTITEISDIFLKIWDGTTWMDDRMSNYLAVTYRPGDLFIGDTNNDRKSEIVTVSPDGDRVYIYEWYDSTWHESAIDVGKNPVSVFVGDADNDGDNEIVTANYKPKDINDGELSIWETHELYDSGDDDLIAPANDANGDPITDGSNENTISILVWDEETESWNVDHVYIGNGPHSVFVGDVDNDGNNDIVTANFAGDDISIVKWDSAAEEWGYSPSVYVEKAPYEVFIADIDYDGDNDIITANHFPNVVRVLKWLNDNDKWAAIEMPFTMPKGAIPYSLYVADVDNDRYMDIVVSDFQDAEVNRAFWEKEEGQYHWATRTYPTSDVPFSLFIGDADNDGYKDLVTLEETQTDMILNILSMGQVVDDFEASSSKSIINKYKENKIFDTTINVVGGTHFKYLVSAKLAPGATDGSLDFYAMEVDDTQNPDITLNSVSITELPNKYRWFSTGEFVTSDTATQIRLVAYDNSPNALDTPGVYIDKIALIRVGDREAVEKSLNHLDLNGIEAQYDYIDVPVIGDLKRMSAETSDLLISKGESTILNIFDDGNRDILPFREVEPFWRQMKDFDTLDYVGQNLESVTIYTGPMVVVNTQVEIVDLNYPTNTVYFETEITKTTESWTRMDLPLPFILSSHTRVTISYVDINGLPIYPMLHKNEVSEFSIDNSQGFDDVLGWHIIDDYPFHYSWLVGINIKALPGDCVPIITEDGIPTPPYIYSPPNPYCGQIKIFDTSDYIGVDIDSVSFYGQFAGTNPRVQVEIDDKIVVQVNNPGFEILGWHTIPLPGAIVKNREIRIAIQYSADDISILKMSPATPIAGLIDDSFTIVYPDVIEQITGTWMMRLNMKIVTWVDIGEDGIYEWLYYGADPVSTELRNVNHEINKYLYQNEDDDSDGTINVPIKVFSNLPVSVTIGALTSNIHPYSTNPFAIDTDKDYLYDGDEIFIDNIERDGIANPDHWFSIPSDSDSDGDLVVDGKELIGSNIDIRTPAGTESRFSYSNPMDIDTDTDKISDYIEYNRFNSYVIDTDDDSIDDTYEVRVVFRTNAVGGEYDMEGVQIAVDIDDNTILDVFEYDSSGSTYSGDPDAMTPEGYEVYIEDSGARVVIDGPVSPIAFLTVASPTFDTSRIPNIDYGIKLQETYIYWTNPIDFDTDNDLLPDGWIEDYYMPDSEAAKLPLNGEDLDGSGDVNGDDNDNIVIDVGEIWLETDPHSKDSDKDGTNDGRELYFDEIIVDLYLTDWYYDGTIPSYVKDAIENYIDSDNDDLYGIEEYDSDNDGKIDPVDTDSDDDGIPDKRENWDFDDELDAAVMPEAPYYEYTNPYENPFFNKLRELNPYNIDTDGDGIADGIELNNDLNPFDWDTDNDLLIDGYLGSGFDAVLGGEDKNNDGLIGGDSDFDGIWNTNTETWTETSPLIRDTDKDNIMDGMEYYYINLGDQQTQYSNSDASFAGGDTLIDLLDKDSDADGLEDGEENWNNDTVLNVIRIEDWRGIYEYYIESDPTNPDCDDDDLLDGAETEGFVNSDEVVPKDFPPNNQIPEDYPLDWYINIWDIDSNDQEANAGNNYDNYPNQVHVDYVETYVVFRKGTYNKDTNQEIEFTQYKDKRTTSHTWIAVDPEFDDHDLHYLIDSTLIPPDLRIYWYIDNPGTAPEDKPLKSQYNGIYIQVYTPEGYEIYIEGTSPPYTVYIKFGAGSYARFGNEQNPVPYTYKDDIHSVAPTIYPSYNFVVNHQETYDGRPALNTDSDFDGIKNGVEEYYETDPNDADSDNDGVLDGEEVFWWQNSDNHGEINALDSDSDNDGLKDGTEMGITDEDLREDIRDDCLHPSNTHYRQDEDPSTKTNMTQKDTDGDGLHDGRYGGSSNFEDRNNDGKFDGVSTSGSEESDPLNLDTDFDGINDGDEYNNVLIRWDKDSDDDGIEDGNYTEGLQNTDGTGSVNALDTDSDGDGIWDGVELGLTSGIADDNQNRWYGTKTSIFRADMDPYTVTDPLSIESDGDGINDGDEDSTADSSDYDGTTGTNYNGRYDLVKDDSLAIPSYSNSETDPFNPDSDGDGFNDDIEYDSANKMWPNDVDSDDDGLRDDDEKEGLQNTDEFLIFNDAYIGDDLVNAVDPDSDGDGLWDGLELRVTTGIEDSAGEYFGTDMSIFQGDTDTGSETDPFDPDYDDDFLSDGIEDANHNGAYDTDETDPNNPDTDDDEIDDGIEDWNHDGLIEGDGGDLFILEYNSGERWLESNPRSEDSDGDFIPDNYEDVNKNGFQDSGETAAFTPDTDNDGLFDGISFWGNLGEYAYGTDPLDDDTDGDTLLDGAEVDGTYAYNSDPNEADSDGDGLSDPEEIVDYSPLDDDFTQTKTLHSWSFMVYHTGSYIAEIEASGSIFMLVKVDSRPRFFTLVGGSTSTFSFDVPLNRSIHMVTIEAPTPITISRISLEKQILNPTEADTDGDGLADNIEIYGWDVCVVSNVLTYNFTTWGWGSGIAGTLEGQDFLDTYWNEYDNDFYNRTTKKYVFHADSDPKKQSTYNDYLTDYENFMNGTDPRYDDTDRDGISDFSEAINYDGSQYNPTIQDYFEPKIDRLEVYLYKDENDNNVEHVYLSVVTKVLDASSQLYGLKFHVKSFHDGILIDTEKKRSKTYWNVNKGWHSHTFDLGSGWVSEFLNGMLSHDITVKVMDEAGNLNKSKEHIEGLAEKIIDFIVSLWNSFVAALEALANALLNIWELIFKPIIYALFDIIMSPILMAINAYVRGVGEAGQACVDEYTLTSNSPGTITSATQNSFMDALFPLLVKVLICIIIVLVWAYKIFKLVVSGGSSQFIDFVIPIIVTAIGLASMFLIEENTMLNAATSAFETFVEWFVDGIANIFGGFLEIDQFAAETALCFYVEIVCVLAGVLSLWASTLSFITSLDIVALIFSVLCLIIIVNMHSHPALYLGLALAGFSLSVFTFFLIFVNFLHIDNVRPQGALIRDALIFLLAFIFNFFGMLLFLMNALGFGAPS